MLHFISTFFSSFLFFWQDSNFQWNRFLFNIIRIGNIFITVVEIFRNFVVFRLPFQTFLLNIFMLESQNINIFKSLEYWNQGGRFHTQISEFGTFCFKTGFSSTTSAESDDFRSFVFLGIFAIFRANIFAIVAQNLTSSETNMAFFGS